MAQGLMLPIRTYFQPRRVADEVLQPGVTGSATPSPVLVYLCALIWVPIGILVGLSIFGLPEMRVAGLPELPGFVLVLVGCGLAVLLGVVVGFWYQLIDKRRAGLTFRYDVAAGVGVALAWMVLFNLLVLDEIAVRNDLDVAHVVDSPTLDLASMFILGTGLGVIACMLGGYLFGAKAVVVFGLPIGIGIVALFATGPNPDVRQANLAFAITAVAFLTHLVWQPVYLVVGLIGNLVARKGSAQSRLLWRMSPANWSEFCYVPLPGLSDLVMTLYRVDPLAGQRAIDRLGNHAFYGAMGKKLSKDIYTGEG
jgi:hypothetical protein